VAKCKYMTTQRVSRGATDIDVSATVIPVVTLIAGYDRTGKVSESKDTINMCWITLPSNFFV